ncbi:MAG: hypothetical protein AB1921_17350 [Thermodesulfobacteriota bacterium]
MVVASPESLLSEEEFSRKLAEACRKHIRVRFTENRSSLLSVNREAEGAVCVSVQHAFRAADEKLFLALARFVERPDRLSRKVIGAFLREKSDLINLFARPAYRPAVIRDDRLTRLLQSVCTEYGFSGRAFSIGWSRDGKKRRRGRRSIRLGSFRYTDGSIRIHPLLQSPRIPEFFLAFIIYHEVLHAELAPQVKNGRKIVHHTVFRKRERAFRHYEQARTFEKKFVSEVLAGRWKG